MGSIISAIIASIFKVGLEYVTGWYKQQQAEVDRFNLAATQAQLASVVAGHELEVKMDQAAANAIKPTTLTDWKASFSVKHFVPAAACLLFMLTLSGCWRVQVTTGEYKPEIKKPTPNSEMFQGPEQLSPREQAMGLYINQINAEVDVHNEDARESNIKNGYVKPKAKSKALKK